ncbi:MAG: hypothetical protein KDD70_06345 [Bdellovibrionales bacterium]|nr:hypothetical protein [Bdellovibrionales bacterium]
MSQSHEPVGDVSRENGAQSPLHTTTSQHPRTPHGVESLLETFSATKEEFLSCEDPRSSFQLLDRLCNILIELDDRELPPSLNTPSSELLRKVAEIDSHCEQQAAHEIITLKINDLEHYPWNLRDYYEGEKLFVEKQIGRAIGRVTVIGHGAIPHSALLFRDHPLELIDIDPEVSTLARNIFDKFSPECAPTIRVADLSQANFKYDQSQAAPPEGVSLAIIANAAVPALLERSTPLPHDFVFIRSATENGALLYPKASLTAIERAGYRVTAYQADSIYGIHEWILCRPQPTSHRIQSAIEGQGEQKA